jgi:predicted RNase H-like HicB family nuclease
MLPHGTVGRRIRRSGRWLFDANTIFEGYVMQEYKAVVRQEGEWWYGWIEEIPGVNCQERSEAELMETLRVTLREAIELNREEARKSASGDFTEVRIAV